MGDGNTALIYACSNGHTEIVKLLLRKSGIDFTKKDNNGRTALMIATDNHHTEIIDRLESFLNLRNLLLMKETEETTYGGRILKNHYDIKRLVASWLQVVVNSKIYSF